VEQPAAQAVIKTAMDTFFAMFMVFSISVESMPVGKY